MQVEERKKRRKKGGERSEREVWRRWRNGATLVVPAPAAGLFPPPAANRTAAKKKANKAGLEPATSRFVVGRSIQLSYMSRFSCSMDTGTVINCRLVLIVDRNDSEVDLGVGPIELPEV